MTFTTVCPVDSVEVEAVKFDLSRPTGKLADNATSIGSHRKFIANVTGHIEGNVLVDGHGLERENRQASLLLHCAALVVIKYSAKQ